MIWYMNQNTGLKVYLVIACHAPDVVITRSVRLAIICNPGIRLAATYAT